MTLWFLTIGALGLASIWRHPDVLWALDPRVGLTYVTTHGAGGFLRSALCFVRHGRGGALCRHGSFRRQPIRLAWYGLVLPALLLNYAGQTALLVDGPSTRETNPFFDLCPAGLQLPLVALATVATLSRPVDHHRRLLDDAPSDTTWPPAAHICSQTSAESYGQIYVGFVNWALMALTLVLTITFRSSDNLAAAFGIAVSMTMLLTSVLMFIAMREVWRWSLPLSLLVAGYSSRWTGRSSRPIW